jgi:hypothetical protein
MADADRPNPSPASATVPVASSLPSVGARVLAVLAIVVAGLCGGLIGYSVAHLGSKAHHAGLASAIGGVVGALVAAGGVAVVSVLVLRAMGEWQMIQATGDPAAPRLARELRRQDEPE